MSLGKHPCISSHRPGLPYPGPRLGVAASKKALEDVTCKRISRLSSARGGEQHKPGASGVGTAAQAEEDLPKRQNDMSLDAKDAIGILHRARKQGRASTGPASEASHGRDRPSGDGAHSANGGVGAKVKDVVPDRGQRSQAS